MASPILHIKDSYYFEVPKALWRHNYSSLEEVPAFLRDAHPHATPAEFSEALDGKILIPQPFGELKNLYEPKSGFAISRFMVIEVVVAAIIAFVFIRLAQKLKAGGEPRGRFLHMLEGLLVYLREQVAIPAIGHHDADRFVPLLWTMFFFIFGCNLMGLVPWTGSPTAAFGVTLVLAGITFLTVVIAGVIRFGPFGFLLNQVPHMEMELPWFLIWLKPVIFVMIFAIELLGLLIKHGVLAVRLLANIFAGHIVLLAIMGMAFSLQGAQSSNWWVMATISVLGASLLSCLELFVALLQAYVFTFLSALFIGAAVHKH